VIRQEGFSPCFFPDQHPITDALDEWSNISGIPTPHKPVLQLVKELVDLHVPNLHINVTSHPEVDIRDVLEPLTSRRVTLLHDQNGQKKDIEDYVSSVVYSNWEPIMRRWRKVDNERADGVSRLIYVHNPYLNHWTGFPESLDETCGCILKKIKKPNRAHARQVLRCLVVAIRPLRVAELAEVLAVDFDDAEGIPRLKPD